MTSPQQPQGGNPFAQGQNPYGYAPQQQPQPGVQPQQPYGQPQPGMQPQGHPYEQAQGQPYEQAQGQPYGQSAYGQPAYGQPPQGSPGPQGMPPYGQPQGMPGPGQTPGAACSFCGGMPAVRATVRGHQGLLIVMRFLKADRIYCRTCGTATLRDMTAKTLWQGWWGIFSFLITPITLLMNIGPRSSFSRLPEPVGGGPRLDPGMPVLRRPAAFMLVIPVIILGLIIWGIAGDTSAATAEVGDCVKQIGTNSVKVVDCTSTDAEYKVLARVDGVDSQSEADEKCSKKAKDTDTYYWEQGRGTDFALCLEKQK